MKLFLINDEVYKKIVGITILCNVGLVLFIFLTFRFFPRVVPLFYSRPWGDQQLTSNLFLFALPVLSFVFLFVNLLIAHLFGKNWEKLTNPAKRDQNLLIVRILAASALFTTLLGAITLIRIFLLIV